MIDLLVVVAEAHAVRLERLVGDLRHLLGLGIDPVDGLLDEGPRASGVVPLALVVHQRPVAGVGEPDGAVVRVHHTVVGRVELLAVVALVGEHRDGAVVLVADHVAGPVAERDLASAVVERVAVAVAGRVPEAPPDVAVLLAPPEALVVRDVAPDEVAPRAVPGAALRPHRARVETHDGRVPELVREPRIEVDHVRLGVARRVGARPEVAGEGLRGHARDRRHRGRALQQEVPAVDPCRALSALRVG